MLFDSLNTALIGTTNVVNVIMKNDSSVSDLIC